MKDINATLIISLEGKTEEEVWRNVKYTRRKYVKQSIKSGLTYEKANSDKDLEKMFEMHMTILEEGGAIKWVYEKWRKFVEPAGDKLFFIKKDNEVVGCFILGEVSDKLYGKDSGKRGIRPLVFANKKEFNQFRPNDYMYWITLKYSLERGYSFVDLGGWQIKARGHLKNVNSFKEEWGGELVYYYLDYPFFTAIRRKLIRNFKVFWEINNLIKKRIGKIEKSNHDELIRDAAARN